MKNRIFDILFDIVADVIVTSFAEELVKIVKKSEYMFADELIDAIEVVKENDDWKENIERLYRWKR